jgi:hypothetical protein
MGTYVLWRLGMEPVPQIAENIVQKLCEFCVDPIASSSRAAVSYSRLTEAGFDSSLARIRRFVDSSQIEESLVSPDGG